MAVRRSLLAEGTRTVLEELMLLELMLLGRAAKSCHLVGMRLSTPYSNLSFLYALALVGPSASTT